jgi:hypothetical protein
MALLKATTACVPGFSLNRQAALGGSRRSAARIRTTETDIYNPLRPTERDATVLTRVVDFRCLTIRIERKFRCLLKK